MDGTPARSGLSYALASPADDATLRALLRDNAMPSWITLSMEREPSWFAAASQPGREWAVIARDGATPVGMYGCHEQLLHCNGRPAGCGYLHSLRVAPSHRHRLRVLRGGFATLPKLRPADGPELWFTSIASENRAARRVLEAGLPGLPRYAFVNGLVTLALAGRGGESARWTPAEGDLAAFCEFHNAQARRYQFAPHLTPETAARCGARFFVARKDGRVCAAMALWNRQAERQIVVRDYRAPLGLLRHVYNLWARARRRPRLPPKGRPLDITYLAFLAIADDAGAQVEALVEGALALNRSEILMLALHDGHPWLPRLRARFRPECYASRLYVVGEAPSLDGRPAQPEVALL